MKGVDSQIHRLANNCINALEAQKVQQPLLDFENLKLKILLAAYSRSGFGKEYDRLVTSPLGQRVAVVPEQWKQIQTLGTVLKY